MTLSAAKFDNNATFYLYNSAYVNDLESSDAIVRVEDVQRHSQHSNTMFGHVNFSNNNGALF